MKLLMKLAMEKRVPEASKKSTCAHGPVVNCWRRNCQGSTQQLGLSEVYRSSSNSQDHLQAAKQSDA